jgi:hypothetical protein
MTSAVYRTTGGKVVSKEILTGSDDVSGYVIDGASIVGTNYGNGTAGLWKYPAGGKPVKTISGFENPIGAAVSK